MSKKSFWVISELKLCKLVWLVFCVSVILGDDFCCFAKIVLILIQFFNVFESKFGHGRRVPYVIRLLKAGTAAAAKWITEGPENT